MNHRDLILITANGPQVCSRDFETSVKILGIKSKYILKHTPEDNGDIESLPNSLKTDCVWQKDLDTIEDAKNLIEYAFNDYNTVRLH